MTNAVPAAAIAAALKSSSGTLPLNPTARHQMVIAAVEAAAPHIAAAERDRIRQGSPHRVEAGGEYCQEDGFRWPCRTARWLADLLGDAP